MDPYVARQQPKWILCAPIIHQKALMGVLFLEQNESPNVEHQLDAIFLFISQVSIITKKVIFFLLNVPERWEFLLKILYCTSLLCMQEWKLKLPIEIRISCF
jgi:hypothetical protein